MTVYDTLLSLPYSFMRRLYCVLDTGQLFYNKHLIFCNGEFKNIPESWGDVGISLADVTGRQLIQSLAEDEENPEVWRLIIADLYQHFSSSRTKYTKYLNFVPATPNDIDMIFANTNFHYNRLALELYVLFHKAQKDLKWFDTSKFFMPITDGCVIYRRWLQ